MADRGSKLALPEESQPIGLVIQFSIQHFQSDAPPLLEVLNLIHLAHTAAAEQPFDSIGSERLAPREPRYVVRPPMRVAEDVCARANRRVSLADRLEARSKETT